MQQIALNEPKKVKFFVKYLTRSLIVANEGFQTDTIRTDIGLETAKKAFLFSINLILCTQKEPRQRSIQNMLRKLLFLRPEILHKCFSELIRKNLVCTNHIA